MASPASSLCVAFHQPLEPGSVLYALVVLLFPVARKRVEWLRLERGGENDTRKKLSVEWAVPLTLDFVSF
jgi:hypothetical protein